MDTEHSDWDYSKAQRELMDGLWALRKKQQLVERAIAEMVAVSRQVDLTGRYLLSWADIGTALGISRQSAWEKFGKRGGLVLGDLDS